MCNSRIANINRQLDASTTTVADITYKEATLAEETRRKSELEEDVKKANYLQQYRDKGKEQKELEERREQLHVELTSLNTQSNVRAKLQLKRSENKKKDEAIQSL
jgi:DNA repair protein RAD50